MQKAMLLVLITVFTTTLKSYAQDSIRTLIPLPTLTHLGFYVAPEFQVGQLKGSFTTFSGGSAMVILNKKLAAGVTMQHNLFRSYSPEGIKPLNLSANFGGLKLEYTVNPNDPIHLSFPLVIGGGFARTDSARSRNEMFNPDLNNDDRRMRPRFDNSVSQGHYFMLQPGVQVDANLFRYVKLFAGANYRFAFDGYSASSLPASTLQGLSFNIGIKAGLFDYAVKKKK